MVARQSPHESRDYGRVVEYVDFLPSKRPSKKVQDLLAKQAVNPQTAAGQFAKRLGLTIELNDKQQGESDVSADRS